MKETIEKFLDELEKSLSAETFIKMTLGNYKGSDEHLQKVFIRIIDTKKGKRLDLKYRFDTRDEVKNYCLADGISIIRDHLDAGFCSGHLFTSEGDHQLEIGKRNARLRTSKPTFETPPEQQHDREKNYLIDPNSHYLKALEIATASGVIRAAKQDKWRQLNKFVEIVGSLFEKSSLKNKKSLSIVDMGSGKGYLTFAVYDYFRNVPVDGPADIRVTGVDTKREMIDLCSEVAETSGFEGLKFVYGTIADFDAGEADILIALHACDTATDDALFKGIAAGAEIIIAAPCCHKEIRRQMKPPSLLKDILKHGVMLERTAETITDGLRSQKIRSRG